MKLLGSQWRDENAPFVNGGAANAESPRYGSVIATEVLQNISGPHKARAYTAVDSEVNGARLSEVSSGERGYRIRYLSMNADRRRAPFNGKVIRELRKQRRLSQDQLADLIGTKKANVSKWERATSYVAISFDLFANLAKALYLPPETLQERLCAPPPSQAGHIAPRPTAAPAKRRGAA